LSHNKPVGCFSFFENLLTVLTVVTAKDKDQKRAEENFGILPFLAPNYWRFIVVSKVDEQPTSFR